MIRLPRLAALLLCAPLGFAALPAHAGPAEAALLKTYEGDWTGTGSVTGPDGGDISCRLSLKAASTGKLSYSGRCTFEAGSMGFRGTMFYNDAKQRFEAAATAQGVATTTIGKRQGSGVLFAAAGIETDYGVASSTMSLNGKSIKLSFKLVDKEGKTTASNISFSKG